MYLQQLFKEDLGCVGYLVGDTDAAVCPINGRKGEVSNPKACPLFL